MSSSEMPSREELEVKSMSDISRRYERFIVGAVVSKFQGDTHDYQVLHEFSVQFQNDPKHVYCRVLDSKRNNMYGVVALFQEDGMLTDYMCDQISL